MRIITISILSVIWFNAQISLAQSDPETARRATVIASIGGEGLTVGNLEDMLTKRPGMVQPGPKQIETLKRMVDDETKTRLLARAARDARLTNNARVTEALQESIVQKLVTEEVLKKVPATAISEQEIRDFYTKNIDRFTRKEERRASHILVDDEDLALELLKQSRGSKPGEFAELAKKHSLDTETNRRGGDLLFFADDGRSVGSAAALVAPELVKAAFAIKAAGENAAAPIDMGNGKFSVLRLTDVRPGSTRSVDQAAASIVQILQKQKQAEQMSEFVSQLKQKTVVERYPERLDWIKLPKRAQPTTNSHKH